MKNNTKKVYLIDNSDASTVIVARPAYNKPVLLWEKAKKAEKKAFWTAKQDLPEIGEAYPYHISRDCIAEYVRVCSEQGFDVSALESVSGEIPPDASPATTTAKISVLRTSQNPVGLTLCPEQVHGDNDAVWDYLKEMRENVSGVVYDKKARGYYVPTPYICNAWEYLAASENPVFDCNGIIPYAELTSRWGNLYTHAIPENPEIILYPYQEQDAQRLLDYRRGLLALEMGLGKTLVSICAAVPVPGKKLVVCPASLRENWVREINRAFPSLTAKICGNKDFSLDADFTIVSYEGMTANVDKLSHGEISVLIIDESHSMKAVDSYGHPASRRAAAYLTISAFTEFVFLLTGTPLINGNSDLWNFMVSASHGLTMGDYAFSSFIKTFTDAEKTRFGWVYSGYKNSDVLYKELSKIMVRRRTREVFPELKKDRESVLVDIDTSVYEEKIAEYMAKRDTDKAAALAELLAARLNLAIEKAKETVDYVRAITEDNNEKIVIFTEFRESADYIQRELGKACVSMTGKQSDAEIEANKDRFQHDDKIRFVVCTYKRAGTGHTLTASHILVINDLPWTFADVVQAEARIYRISQKETAQIRFVLSGEVAFDTYISKKVCGKSANANAVVDNNEGDVLKLNMSTYFGAEDDDFDDYVA